MASLMDGQDKTGDGKRQNFCKNKEDKRFETAEPVMVHVTLVHFGTDILGRV